MRTRRIRGLPRQDTPPQEAPIPAAQTFAPSVYDAWTREAARDTNQKSTRDFLACIHVFIDGLEDSYIKANLRIGLQNYPGLRPPVVTRSPDDPSANQVMPAGAAQRGGYLECDRQMMWLLFNGRGTDGEVSCRNISAFTQSWPREVVDAVAASLDGAGFMSANSIRDRINRIPDPRPQTFARPPQQGMTERAEEFNNRRTIDELRALINHHNLRIEGTHKAIGELHNKIDHLTHHVFVLRYALFAAVFAVAMSLTFVYRHWHLP